jgi:hypothetical protein
MLAVSRVGYFYMAMNYFFRVFLPDLDGHGQLREQQISFDSTFIVAGDGPMENDHEVKLEQDGRNELVKIVTFKRFAASVTRETIHTIHTLFLLEQKNSAVTTDIALYKWDDTVKRDKEGNASLTKLATVVSDSRITRHTVTVDEDGYWFNFEFVGGAEFDDQPGKK